MTLNPRTHLLAPQGLVLLALLTPLLALAPGCSTGTPDSGSASGSTTGGSTGSGGGTPGGGGTSAPAPEILGVRWPGAQGGELVRVIGRNFDTAPGAVVVQFPGNAHVTATAESAVEIKVYVPYTAQSGQVVVESGGQLSNPFPFTMWGVGSLTRIDDHGDTAVTATALTLGQPTATSVDRARDVDVFAVDLVAGVPYVMRTVDLSHAMDTIITLYDSFGQYVALNDDLDGYGRGSGLDFTPTTSGRYYLSCAHWRWNADVGAALIVVQDAAQAAPASTAAFNTAPQIETVGGPPSGVQSEAVSFQYTVNDPEGDRLAILAFYREWSSTASAYTPATVHVSSDPLTNVSSSSSTRVYTFVWDSRADVGAASGTYQVEFMASDGTTVGRLDDSGAFTLSNP